MNLKNISKFKFLFFIFLSILLVSCSERKEIISKIDNSVLEKKDSIEISNYNKTRKSFLYLQHFGCLGGAPPLFPPLHPLSLPKP